MDSADYNMVECPPCGGSGKIVLNPHWPNGSDPHQANCADCGGSGRLPRNETPTGVEWDPEEEGWVKPYLVTHVGYLRRIPGRFPPDDIVLVQHLTSTGYTTEDNAVIDGWRRVYIEGDL